MLITKKQKKLMLNAITAMEKHYLGKRILETIDCPICSVSYTCDDCMWVRIEGMTCGYFAGKMGYKAGADYLKTRRIARWARKRLEQLPKWRRWVKIQPIMEE